MRVGSVEFSRSSVVPAALFLLALAAGAYLRLHLLSSQILLDDEWHGIIKVTGRTLSAVATNLNPTDNATVPFSLYNWSLYRWFHWSEWTLRLPSILAGLASLVLLPLLIRRVLGLRVASIFAILLAIAPVLVFYSRYARAYSLAALLSTLVLLLSHRWLTTARTRYAVGSVLLGGLAVYVHLTSLVAVLAPLVLAFSLLLAGRFNLASSAAKQIVVSKKALLFVGIGDIALCLPIASSVLLGNATLRWVKGTLTVEAFLTALSLISGTANVPAIVLFFALCVAGHVLLWRDEPLLSRMFLFVMGSYVVLLLASRPDSIQSGLVVVRYMIVVVPIALIGVALAIDRVTAKLSTGLRVNDTVASAAGGVVLAGCFFLAGPLPELQRAPNNFTGHRAFQGSYRPPSWDRSDPRPVEEPVPLLADRVLPFYLWLHDRGDVAAIVEYPYDVCNFNDFNYYYQHVHRKRVLVGYRSDPRRTGVTVVLRDEKHADSITRMLGADSILSRLPADARIAFRNMVDVSNRDALRLSGADLIVLHKFVPISVANSDGTLDTLRVHFTSVDDMSVEFQKSFGSPVYEDAELVCFRIKPDGPAQFSTE